MHGKFVKAVLQLFIIGIIIATAFVINDLLPLNFSFYFVFCAISILLSLKIQYKGNGYKRFTLIVPWLITTITSFLVTINYLCPKDLKVYNNSDANVLALKGVNIRDSLILVGKDKTSSLFDNPDLEGYLSVKPVDSSFCKISYDIHDQPLYLSSPKQEIDKLLNASSLPSFNQLLVIADDSLKCTITIVEANETKWFTSKREFPYFKIKEKEDSMLVSVCFENRTSKNTYKSNFHKRIKDSYNLYDVIHKNVSFEPDEELFIDRLRDISIIRNKDFDNEKENENINKFFITYNHSLDSISLICDGIKFKAEHNLIERRLSSDDYIYIGQYTTETRPMSFSVNKSGFIEGRYKFPYLYNFPRYTKGEELHDGQRKILAISSSTKRILQSDVEEAFFCDLFNEDNNVFTFSGTITYKASSCNTPLSLSIIDDQQRENMEENTFLANNGAIWYFNVYDLRQYSPITGEKSPFVNNIFIFFCIAICCLFPFLSTLFFKDKFIAGCVFTTWLFLIPIFIFRFYLLWRIAVFPPVSDITMAVFQRYRMENSGFDNAMINTLVALFGLFIFTITSIFLQNKRILSASWGNKILFKSLTNFKFLFCLLWVISILLSLLFSGVFVNICVPVVIFVFCEYIALIGLNYKWRTINAILTTCLLCYGDPGYAIMFVIFLCVYFIIHLYAYLKSNTKITTNKAFGFIIWIILFVTLGLTIIFSSQLVAFAYDNTTQILIPYLTPSKILFTAVAIIVCTVLYLYYKIKSKNKLALSALCSIPILSVLLFYLGTVILEKEPHFKYRSLVHTEQVSEIMAHEDFDDRNSIRVLEASQNQWFIQYHNNRGTKRILDNGIFFLSPHFKKGVSWNTQISDVIISRYVVGEISEILPIAIVLFAFSFLCFVFYSVYKRNVSVAGRSVGYSVALLLVIQMIFVWMAATNRMIFFGQDFPFLSQNARITMYMFVVLIGFYMLVSNSTNIELENSSNIQHGLDVFAQKKIPLFFIIFILTFTFVWFWGNNYSSLYCEEDDENSNDASEYNLSRMMNRCEKDLVLVNQKLASSQIKVRSLKDGESLATLMDSLENEYGKGSLTNYVENLYKNKDISKFTLSMYNAFRKNLKRRNSITNIIHLKLNSSRTHYEFALNNGFYTLRNPEFEALAWKDNIYSDNVRNISDTTVMVKRNGYVIYSIPRSWLPKGSEIGIVDATDVNSKTINQSRTLHSEHADYIIDLPIYPIKAGEVLEVSSNDKKKSESYRYGISQEDLLVKNMVINGKRKFFYPLKEKCFWLRNFSDLVSYCYTNKEDSVIITLDKELIKDVYNKLTETGVRSSVVAMDGLGNVRVMADYKGYLYEIDPNDEEMIYETIKYTYLNPIPSENTNFFGNMNLCYLLPGPGSSLKPITYAAVTSQSLNFPWENMKLMSPSPQYYNNDSIQIGMEDNQQHSYLYKFGPSYKYKHPFKSPYTDENGNWGYGEQKWIDNIFYIAKSSNYYNALVTYLGLFGGLGENLLSSTIFRPAKTSDYPKITVDNGNTVYTFCKTPENDNTRNNLLLNGLWNNFSITTYTSYSDSLIDCFIGNKFSKVSQKSSKKLVSLFPWVYPSNSYILEYLLDEKNPSDKLKQYALGAAPLQITPMKMAEMYGKLYSLHPDYHATIIPNAIPFTEKWRGASGDDVSQEEIFSFYQNSVFAGMHECVKRGTARTFFLGLPDNYSYYAKTGTLRLSDKHPNDRMLAVVITNKPIESVSSASELKFYVVYFRFEKLDVDKKDKLKAVGEILKIILESKSFKNYMH